MASSTTFDPHQDPPKINGDLQEVARRVHEEFDEQLDATVVNANLERVSAMFTDAKIRRFVPLLVRRYVNDELHVSVVKCFGPTVFRLNALMHERVEQDQPLPSLFSGADVLFSADIA
jgi:hypothetical protein